MLGVAIGNLLELVEPPALQMTFWILPYPDRLCKHAMETAAGKELVFTSILIDYIIKL
jgi:hypothetical protein